MQPNQHRDDDYLPCHQYSRENADETGITRFEINNKFYFSFIENDEIILRSEGYASEAGRENGVASVLKNIMNEEMYFRRKLPDGRWVLSLKAVNHQEIARSCPYNTEEEVLILMPGFRAKNAEWLALATIEAGKVKQEGIAFEDDNHSSEKIEDDYMICREYEEKIDHKHPDYDDFIIFKHENTGKFYFAMVNSKNEIVFRSEGYPTSSTRDNGLESVRTNREIEKRLFVEEKRGLHYLVLKAGNNQEIARSCPKHSEALLWEMWEETGLNKPIKALADTGLLATSKPAFSDADTFDKEDDYLACEEYKNHEIVDKNNQVAFFKKNDLHYFVFYNIDGSVRLRSEGFINTANRDVELESVLKHIDNKDFYETTERAGHNIQILKDEKGKEVGRSCSERVAIPLAGTINSGTTNIKSKNQRMNWLWLLLPVVLLLGLLLLTKTCKNSGDQSNSIPATTPDCDLNLILFDYNQSEITSLGRAELEQMAKVLMNNSSYTATLIAYTDANESDDTNHSLSNKRGEEAKNILVDLGVNFTRITTSVGSKNKPIAKNNEDDSDSRFNRRVELYVFDAKGKEVCKIIAPKVPNNLQEN